MKLEDTPLNPVERAAAEKWMAKHKAAHAEAVFDAETVVGGYGYRMKIVCTTCGTREDVTDLVAHGGYPHR
ncbi:MAG TPA: hypothetical protein VFF06_16070 [Polyangia bacterium]|nr:hypothetical protein [Polyangia bacterium]